MIHTPDHAPHTPRASSPSREEGLGQGAAILDNPALWQRLHEEAVAAMKRAYAPYSHFPVGAAAFTTDGRIVSGCNIENAAYGATLCAECSMISELFATGGGTLLAFACVDGRGQPLAPCGRCRQLLSEHADDRLTLAMPAGLMTIDEVLPGRFSAANIHDVVDQPSAT